MTSNAPSQGPSPLKSSAPYKRSFRNYLLDSKFQLKYTSFLVLIAVLISGVLGAFLYRTSREVVAESEKVVDESRKVSDVVRMTIREDPVYGSNAELAGSFNAASVDSDKVMLAHQDSLVHQQQVMLWALVGALALLVVLIGMLGIYFTHKVAGPIFKMKKLLRQVADGKLSFRGRLRRGDELQDFFDEFAHMVESLRARQQGEVDQLSAAMDLARAAGASPVSIEKVATVRDEMQRALQD
jgi:methyl-accepting chemotaxis protein